MPKNDPYDFTSPSGEETLVDVDSIQRLGDPGRQEREEEMRQRDKGKVTWVKVWTWKFHRFRDIFKKRGD